LIAIVFAVASVTWGYFTLVEQINQLQSDVVLLQMEQRSNSEFRIKWPRGEMGSLPDDARQDMKLENMEGKISDLAHMDSEFEVVRMRVAALEDFALRPSRSTAHIKEGRRCRSGWLCGNGRRGRGAGLGRPHYHSLHHWSGYRRRGQGVAGRC
jgi:hypothetical protein